MNTFLLNVLLAIAWAALSGDFSPNSLIFGFLLGFVVLWLTVRSERGYFHKVPLVIGFIFFFLYELTKANLNMARIVLSPKPDLKPGVIAVPVDLPSDAAITLLVNLITLTPGTLGLDVSNDKKVIYVHALDARNVEAFRAYIKSGFERRVKELFT